MSCSFTKQLKTQLNNTRQSQNLFDTIKVGALIYLRRISKVTQISHKRVSDMLATCSFWEEKATMGKPMSSKNISVSLPEDVVKELKWLVEQREHAENRRIDPVEALRQAIATDSYIRQAIEKNGKVTIQKPNQSQNVA